ncbi:MAG: MotA/TolQ/ExbB proton channel family protein [Geobacteraceae bacterium]|nr:MotA/TolQ/ExbB proton channel family protein [Geobacteraceae bacterium]
MNTKIAPCKGNMFYVLGLIAVLILLLGLFSVHAEAQDARTGVQSPEALLERARAHKEDVAARIETLSRVLETDRKSVEEKLTQLRDEVEGLDRTHADLQKQVQDRRTQLETQKKLEQEHNQQHAELLGSIRTNVADVVGMVKNSPVTALEPHQDQRLEKFHGSEAAPGIQEVRILRTLMLEQIQDAAQVQRERIIVVNRTGKRVDAEVVLLGAFTALYRSDAEVGFALYSPPSRQLLALSQAPGYTVKKDIEAYIDGGVEAAPIDIGHGASLRQMTYERSLGEQVQYGGFIVWPILGIALVALVLVLERVWFLSRQRYDAEEILHLLQPCIEAQKWKECQQICEGHAAPPARVFRAGIPFVTRPRAELENVLQEAILAEIPAQERFLSTLAVLASIAPLLGLLGTVTGMIHTFELITFHGTGDPRMLSSGISEALVTTMFGLGVAIPVMLAHSLISRRVESRIADLEEKAISFVNRVTKARQAEKQTESVATEHN